MERFVGALSLTLLLSGLAAVAQVSPSQTPTSSLVNAEILPALQGDLAQADAAVSRAELANLLVTTFKLDSAKQTAASSRPSDVQIADVSVSHWAYKDIQTALQSGIMTVYSGGKFLPDHRVTRVEAFAALAKAHRTLPNSHPDSEIAKTDILSQYPDSHQIPGWARQSIAVALHQGFINVRSDKRIDPLSVMTRADMVHALRHYHFQEIPTGLRLPFLTSLKEKRDSEKFMETSGNWW